MISFRLSALVAAVFFAGSTFAAPVGLSFEFSAVGEDPGSFDALGISSSAGLTGTVSYDSADFVLDTANPDAAYEERGRISIALAQFQIGGLTITQNPNGLTGGGWGSVGIENGFAPSTNIRPSRDSWSVSLWDPLVNGVPFDGVFFVSLYDDDISRFTNTMPTVEEIGSLAPVFETGVSQKFFNWVFTTPNGESGQLVGINPAVTDVTPDPDLIAPVPLPAAGWLLFGTVLGLRLLRRR